jgi:hypothetical protein
MDPSGGFKNGIVRPAVRVGALYALSLGELLGYASGNITRGVIKACPEVPTPAPEEKKPLTLGR